MDAKRHRSDAFQPAATPYAQQYQQPGGYQQQQPGAYQHQGHQQQQSGAYNAQQQGYHQQAQSYTQKPAYQKSPRPEQREVYMGMCEQWMDKVWVMDALAQAGHPCINVKRHLNKTKTDEYAEYCFIEFNSQAEGQKCVDALNGNPMDHPDLKGRRRLWKLSWGSRSNNQVSTVEHSVFVGDISGDVTEEQLHHFFKMRYPSVLGAKLQMDDQGRCKGYGFVKFGLEAEQQQALQEMTNGRGLGTRAIRVGLANGTKHRSATSRFLEEATQMQAMQHQQAWAAYYAQQAQMQQAQAMAAHANTVAGAGAAAAGATGAETGAGANTATPTTTGGSAGAAAASGSAMATDDTELIGDHDYDPTKTDVKDRLNNHYAADCERVHDAFAAGTDAGRLRYEWLLEDNTAA